MRSDQGLEHHHPAGIGGPLKQSVRHLWDVHIGLLGGLNQVWGRIMCENSVKNEK